MQLRVRSTANYLQGWSLGESMRPGAKDALRLPWVWGHGCVSACGRSSHCPRHGSSHTWHSALLWHGTAE